MIELAAGAASTVQGEAVSIGPAVEVDPVIWTARLRTGRVVTLRASGSRAFRAAALIASVAAEDLGGDRFGGGGGRFWPLWRIWWGRFSRWRATMKINAWNVVI